jgi:hypothetical protein
MVRFYKMRVINGNKKWTDVPPTWKEAVMEALNADGYILNEDGTVTKVAADE